MLYLYDPAEYFLENFMKQDLLKGYTIITEPAEYFLENFMKQDLLKRSPIVRRVV